MKVEWALIFSCAQNARDDHAHFVSNHAHFYGGWIVSKVQSVFWRRVTSLRRGVVSTGGGTFLLEDASFCGGVYFDLEEGV